jgi:NADH-quinone oxidoreductase subunit N
VSDVDTLSNVFWLILPEMVLGLVACVLFLGATFDSNRHLWGTVALVGLAAAAVALAFSNPSSVEVPAAVYVGSVFVDPFGVLVKWIALVGGAVLVLLSWNEVPDRQSAEYHGCLLLMIAGVCLTGVANELVTLFLALELVSIPTYVLLYLPRYDRPAQEAAMKYFLLSIFSSGLLLFGFSYLYGLAGTTNLPALAAALNPSPPVVLPLPGLAQVALVMVIAGLGFRITAVPFHFYAPDVYQGTPTAAAAILAFVPKVAGFIALFRVLGFVLPGASVTGLASAAQVPGLLWILAAVTMSLGNLLALLQDNLKRLLAYSSVAHAGYMLIGLAVASHLHNDPVGSGLDAVLFYLVAYGAMTVGAFGVLAYLSTPQRPVETVDDLAGLSKSHSGVALLMCVFLLSLIGIPLTAGFAGKLLLFWGAMAVPQSGQPRLFRLLALIGVLNAAVGGWYYLRIIAVMYLRTAVKPLAVVRSWPGLATLWACALVTLVLGVYPWLLVKPARGVVTPGAEKQAAVSGSSHVSLGP